MPTHSLEIKRRPTAAVPDEETPPELVRVDDDPAVIELTARVNSLHARAGEVDRLINQELARRAEKGNWARRLAESAAANATPAERVGDLARDATLGKGTLQDLTREQELLAELIPQVEADLQRARQLAMAPIKEFFRPKYNALIARQRAAALELLAAIKAEDDFVRGEMYPAGIDGNPWQRIYIFTIHDLSWAIKNQLDKRVKDFHPQAWAELSTLPHEERGRVRTPINRLPDAPAPPAKPAERANPQWH